MVELWFFHFRAINSNLKNITLRFELLTQSWLKLEIQFYLCPVPSEGHREKTSLSFWSPTNSNYFYIIISYCSQPFFSKLILLVTRKQGVQN